MQEQFKYEVSEVDSALYFLKNAATMSGFVEQKLNDILSTLGSNDWQGKSHEKCVNHHMLIMQYSTKLKLHGEEIVTHCSAFNDDKKAFHPNSVSVAKLK